MIVGEDPTILEIIRETNDIEQEAWLNRYCQNPQTLVISPNHDADYRKQYITANGPRITLLHFAVAISLGPSLRLRILALTKKELP